MQFSGPDNLVVGRPNVSNNLGLQSFGNRRLTSSQTTTASSSLSTSGSGHGDVARQILLQMEARQERMFTRLLTNQVSLRDAITGLEYVNLRIQSLRNYLFDRP